RRLAVTPPRRASACVTRHDVWRWRSLLRRARGVLIDKTVDEVELGALQRSDVVSVLGGEAIGEEALSVGHSAASFLSDSVSSGPPPNRSRRDAMARSAASSAVTCSVTGSRSLAVSDAA